MIIGYQVRTAQHTFAAPFTANDVLSSTIAEKTLRQLRSQDDNTYFMAAILDGDIENPHFIGENTLLNTTIRDWRLYDAESANDVPESEQGEYLIDIVQERKGSQIFVSIYDKALEPHKKDLPMMGLNLLIEIRDGIPALSAGISPDENIVHLLSNNCNEIAIIKESEQDEPQWQPVESIQGKHNGLCFFVNDYDTLAEIREIVANNALQAHDFGQCQLSGEHETTWTLNNRVATADLLLLTPCDSLAEKRMTISFLPNSWRIDTLVVSDSL